MREISDEITFEKAVPVVMQSDHGKCIANHIEEKMWKCIDELAVADVSELPKTAGAIAILRELIDDIESAARGE